MAITKLNSLAIPPDTIVESDLSYPLTNFSSTGIDDNATSNTITINSSENVGIGTNDPTQLLHIAGDGNIAIKLDSTSTGGDAWRIFSNSDTSSQGGGSMAFYNEDTTAYALNLQSNGKVGIGLNPSAFSGKVVITDGAVGGTTYLDICNGSNDNQFLKLGIANNLGVIGYDNNDGLAFGQFTSAVDTAFVDEHMRINVSGNLGVGASTSILGQIHVYGSGASPKGEIRCENVGTGTNNRGIVRVKSATSTYGGGLFYTNNAESSYENNAVHVFNFDNGPLVFGASNSEQARIDASGNLLAGTTNSNIVAATSGSGFVWQNQSGYAVVGRDSVSANLYLNSTGQSTSNVTDYLGFRNSGTNVGKITYDGADVFIAQISDQRLKENIVEAEPALPLINAMQVRSFDWVSNIKKSKRFGFVAQELKEAFSDAVSEGGDDENENPWTVSEAKLIPVLTKAIQEQQAMIETLQAQVAELQGAN